MKLLKKTNPYHPNKQEVRQNLRHLRGAAECRLRHRHCIDPLIIPDLTEHAVTCRFVSASGDVQQTSGKRIHTLMPEQIQAPKKHGSILVEINLLLP